MTTERKQVGNVIYFKEDTTDEEILKCLPKAIEELITEIQSYTESVDLSTLNIIFHYSSKYAGPLGREGPGGILCKATLGIKCYADVQMENAKQEE